MNHRPSHARSPAASGARDRSRSSLGTRSRLRRAVLTGSAALVALIAPQAAQAACPDQPTTQAFAAYGDTAEYDLAPGGNFESSTSGWTFQNSKVVTGNGSLLGVVDSLLGGTKSLSVGSGFFGTATVTTPPFCVDASHPFFRYMLKANGPVGQLSTYLQYRATDGLTTTTEVKSLTSTTLLPSQWKPSDLNPLGINIPLVNDGGTTAQVRVIFKSSVSVLGAGYQVDNVLIDPYRRG